MTMEIDSVAEALFEKIRNRFEGVNVGDEKAKACTEPAKARFFNFDYTNDRGDNFGNVTVSLIDERSLKIYFGKNLSADLDDLQRAEWYDFLRDLRMFAKRNLLSFDTRDISRSNLNIKDLKQLAATENPVSTNDEQVTESKLYGTTKTSYDPIAPGVSLIIRHSSPVDDEKRGARSRRIHKIYIQDQEGQRFVAPFTHLAGSRVLGRHVAHGGQMGDEFGAHIVDMVDELAKLRRFVKASKRRTFEDGSVANDMVRAAHDRADFINSVLHKLKNKRMYEDYKEKYKPAKTLQDDLDHQKFLDEFAETKIDPRFEEGLAPAAMAYFNMKKNTSAMPTEAAPAQRPATAIDSHMDRFSDTLDQIQEGTWAVPDNDMAIKDLQELMSDVLTAGIDGNDATGALYNILGDDDLFDRIYDASRGSPEMDVRPIVYDWLKSNMPSVFEKVKANMENGGNDDEEEQEPAPQPAPPPPPAPAPAPAAPPAPGGEAPPAPGGEEEEQQQPPAQPPLQQPGTESIRRNGKALNEYFSVESNSPPYYIHSTEFIDSANRYLKEAHARGQRDAVIYEVTVSNGKKTKKLLEAKKVAKIVESKDSAEIIDIRRLAGLR